MTWQLAVDPGQNSGIVLGYYDAVTPYQLHQRWQVHGGLEGFMDWLDEVGPTLKVEELVVEKFVLVRNEFVADLSGVPIEGVIAYYARQVRAPVIWQTRTAKAALVGYPPEANTPAKRQRVRFNFLKEHGLFKPGTENDDSNDAASHAVISLKRRKHAPTLKAYYGRAAA